MKTLLSALSFATVLGSVISSAAFAGDGLTQIDCKSASGKTTVHATMTDGGEKVFQYTLRNANDTASNTYTYVNYMARINIENGNESAVQKAYPGAKNAAIVNFETKSTLAFQIVTIDEKGDDEIPVSLTSVEGTLQAHGAYEVRQTTFRAVLSGFDPRVTSGYKGLGNVKMSCKMQYSL